MKSVTQIVHVRQWCFGFAFNRPLVFVLRNGRNVECMARRARENDLICYCRGFMESQWVADSSVSKNARLKLIQIRRSIGVSILIIRRSRHRSSNLIVRFVVSHTRAISAKPDRKIILEMMHDADSRDL